MTARRLAIVYALGAFYNLALASVMPGPWALLTLGAALALAAGALALDRNR